MIVKALHAESNRVRPTAMALDAALLPHRKLYPQRWWLAFVFSLLGIMQACCW